MSANANIVQGPEVIGSSMRKSVLSAASSDCAANQWNPEDFAREQILSLVRRVFFANSDRPARQVVFSAVERNIDVVSICDQVARALAKQTVEHVAVVDVEHAGYGGDVHSPFLPQECLDQVTVLSNRGQSLACAKNCGRSQPRIWTWITLASLAGRVTKRVRVCGHPRAGRWNIE